MNEKTIEEIINIFLLELSDKQKEAWQEIRWDTSDIDLLEKLVNKGFQAGREHHEENCQWHHVAHPETCERRILDARKDHHPEGFLQGSECEKCHELVDHTRNEMMIEIINKKADLVDMMVKDEIKARVEHDILNEMLTKHKIPEHMKVVPENISTENMFSFAESYAEMRVEHVLDELEKHIEKKDTHLSLFNRLVGIHEKLSELRKVS